MEHSKAEPLSASTATQSSWTHTLGSLRPPFLLLVPACIFLALANAISQGHDINLITVTLVTICAVSANISVNTFNEYFDYKSGLDDMTHRTPFSGGSGTLQKYPDKAKQVFNIGVASSLLTIALGAVLISMTSWKLLPLGLVGLLTVLFYSTHITRSPIMSLISPGLAFGPVMVIGSGLVFTGVITVDLVFLSAIPFFLVNNLLLLNQFPDVEADQRVGRKNLPIKYGKKASGWIFILFYCAAYLTLVFGFWLGYFNRLSLLGLITLVVAIPLFIGVHRYANNQEKLVPYMGLNVAVNLVTPVLVGLGLILGQS